MTTILVADDKPSIREVIREFLQDSYEVLEASNGEEAIAAISTHQVDVVILDVNMPVTDGWEALRVIGDEENGWPEIKVIMLTVNNHPEAALKAWSLGATFFLPKPFRTNDLIQTLEKALTA